ncbi:hypothetical protein [Marinobacter changyiensis]|uniref:hypothetical protein n=1 Tax=Marinobacter changyiensis TaxID=2604091 RepID=UPI001265A7C8|nr:hypothetical protein [Marinobacter changyiensis]
MNYLLTLILLLFSFFPISAISQEFTEEELSRISRANDEIDKASEKQTPIVLKNQVSTPSSYDIYKMKVQHAIASEKYKIWTLTNFINVHERQGIISYFIFALVAGLTLFSMFLVWLQFHIYSLKVRSEVRIKEDETSEDHDTQQRTEEHTIRPIKRSVISISKEGLSLDTPFIGVVILVITFFFLNSYLDKVYPIHISQNKESSQADALGKNQVPGIPTPKLE